MKTSRKINAQYNVVKPGSLPDQVAAHMRRKMFHRFLSTGVSISDTILDVGVTSDRSQAASNYLEAWYPHKHMVTACGIDDASFLETMYPGVRFVNADGKNLPFGDEHFDYVHSSAVLEHVGSWANQLAFVAELLRVSRKRVFLTTPNRWFPVEFHTTLPLLHWLPKPVFRSAIKRLGHEDLSKESNLNLLGAADLKAMCEQLGIANYRINHLSLLLWPSNLILEIEKRPH